MEVALRIKLALQLLMQAHDYSVELGSNCWDFAVDSSSLHELGLSKNDLRWLLHKNFAIQAHEVTEIDDDRRVFVHNGKMQLIDTSCFILTEAGIALAGAFRRGDVAPSNGEKQGQHTGNGATSHAPPHPQTLAALAAAKTPIGGNGFDETARPIWDKDRRMLRFGAQVVKQFKVPAPNQEIILESFEEDNWPIRIDDPLPRQSAVDPKRRLHDTINSLNRNQRANLLRFTGDGSGEAICWEKMSLACLS
jgi:hypothetical protein